MKRRLLFAVIAVCFACVAARAQQPAATDQPSAEEIRQLFKLMHIDQQMLAGMDGMRTLMEPMVRENVEKLAQGKTPEQRQRLQKVMDDYLNNLPNVYPVSEMEDDVVPIYQRHFSRAEIQAIAKFYSTPVGQKFLTETPAITRETMELLSPKIRAKVDATQPELQRKITEALADDSNTSSRP